MRSVRTEFSVDEALEQARSEWERLDDAWAMIEWVLARDPTKGIPLSESGKARAFVFEGSNVHAMPNIEVVYVEEPFYVTIKSVRFSRPTYSAGLA